MNLNEIAYQLKEQGLSYIQIGFVLKEIQGQHKLERRLKPGVLKTERDNGAIRRPITIRRDLHIKLNSPVSGA